MAGIANSTATSAHMTTSLYCGGSAHLNILVPTENHLASGPTHQHTSHVCWATFTVFLLCLKLCRSIDATFANMMTGAGISIGLWGMAGVVWLHYNSCGRSADQLRDTDLARWFAVGTKNPLVSPTACWYFQVKGVPFAIPSVTV